MLCSQPYNLSNSGMYDVNYVVRYEDSRGYYSEIYINSYSYYYYNSTRIQYTLEGLTLGLVYNISVRASVRPISGCYSYINGEYSNAVLVETIETGKSPVKFLSNTVDFSSLGMFNCACLGKL